MTRQQPGLRAPADVTLVPDADLAPPLWRAVANRHPHPWWYASRDRTADPGRFDLRHPHGTCYWAGAPETAIIEATVDPDQTDPPVITIAALQQLNVWRCDDQHVADGRLADVTIASVPELTAEISTIVPYTLPWQWADALHADARAGIAYTARLGMGSAIARFGEHGAPADPLDSHASPGTTHIADLPDGYRVGISTPGTLASFPRATPP